MMVIRWIMAFFFAQCRDMTLYSQQCLDVWWNEKLTEWFQLIELFHDGCSIFFPESVQEYSSTSSYTGVGKFSAEYGYQTLYLYLYLTLSRV